MILFLTLVSSQHHKLKNLYQFPFESLILMTFFLFRENATPEEIMKKLIRVAQEKGVTDDVAGIVIRL